MHMTMLSPDASPANSAAGSTSTSGMFTTPEEEDDDEVSDQDTTPGGWAAQADGPAPWAMHSLTANPSATEPLQHSGIPTDIASGPSLGAVSTESQSSGAAGGLDDAGCTREEFEMVQLQLQGLQAQVSEYGAIREWNQGAREVGTPIRRWLYPPTETLFGESPDLSNHATPGTNQVTTLQGMLTGIQGVVKQVLEVQVGQLQRAAEQQGAAADVPEGPDCDSTERGPASKRRALT